MQVADAYSWKRVSVVLFAANQVHAAVCTHLHWRDELCLGLRKVGKL